MKTRIITGVLFTVAVVLLLALAYVYPMGDLVLTLLVGVWSTVELERALSLHFTQPPMRHFSQLLCMGLLLPYVFEAILPRVLTESGMESPILYTTAVFGLTALVMLLTVFLGGMIILLRRGVEGLPQVVSTAGAGLYIMLPLSLIPVLHRGFPLGFYWLVLALFSPWASDVCAYFAGYFFGKRKLIPHISPKKTIAGFVGGILGSVVLTLVFFLVGPESSGKNLPLAGILCFAVVSGVLLSLASQLGDWIASVIKRYLGIKDYGNFLPGHGGMLDRFDSVLYTLPMTFLLALIYSLF